MDPIKKYLIFFIVLMMFLVVLYFTDSDRGRLAKAYRLDNSLLCNLIINYSVRTKCIAVIDTNFLLCDSIADDNDAYLCYLGVAVRRGDPAFDVDLIAAIKSRCYKSIPAQRDFLQRRGINKTGEELREGCSSTGLAYADYFYQYFAFRNSDMNLCVKINDDFLRYHCTQVIIENRSFLCEHHPDLCFYKRGDDGFCISKGDACYLQVAILTGDIPLCRFIEKTSIQDECYLYFLEPPPLRCMC